ncbi:vomeronasal type-2 receptor 26-like [Lissotriton helveticus]
MSNGEKENISFGALDPALSDKVRFPSFYRTFPNELSHYEGIAQLLQYFGWSWVGILATDDENGVKAVQRLKVAIAQHGGCVEFSYMFPIEITEMGHIALNRILNDFGKTTAQVMICYSTGTSLVHYLMRREWLLFPHKTCIASVSFSFFADFSYGMNLRVFNGTLFFSIKKREIFGLLDFLHSLRLSSFSEIEDLSDLWQEIFDCRLMGKTKWKLLNSDYMLQLKICSGNETLKSLTSPEYGVSDFRISYSMYTAVYALAHSLHNILFSDSRSATVSTSGHQHEKMKPWKLNRFLRKIHFMTPSGDDFTFDDAGDVPGLYDIVNLVVYPNGTTKETHVGSFDTTATAGHELVINQSSIIWHSMEDNLNQFGTVGTKRTIMHQESVTVEYKLGLKLRMIPRSVCSESCHPGYRKAPIEGKPSCCFLCVPCAEEEFSNSTDMENCLKCPDDQWPNHMKTGCIQKDVVYLSYSDSLGVSLVSVSIGCSIITAGVLGIFLRHRDTPIVKANNQNISYTLLVFLMLAFLCSLLFIGHPTPLTCMIQQAAFGIIFTVAVSCVLAKTITVVIAFRAIKPGSRLNRWLGYRVSASMILLPTMGEVVICLTWLLTSPPHPDMDTQFEMGKLILQCAMGSVTAFYSVIGYMGLLAILSFIVSFLARNLPDRFNEAKLITFSMLVFCSVWISFIPAYLSTKGRYMVTVEIFAILASSAGLLGCIFFPKCYIIILKPDVNKKEYRG